MNNKKESVMLYSNYKSNLSIATLLACLVFSPLSYAENNDPCNNIAGEWKGTAEVLYNSTRHCKMNMTMKILRYQDTIRMEAFASNKVGDCSTTVDHIIQTGRCNNAFISIRDDNVTGTIFGNSIVMMSPQKNYPIERMELEKSVT